MDRANGDDSHFLRIDIARHHALQRRDQRGCGEHRVDGPLRFRAMAALADNLDVALIDRSHGRAGDKAELP
ncbi:hypothetical protein D3C78_1459690 [compost metagenome]